MGVGGGCIFEWCDYFYNIFWGGGPVYFFLEHLYVVSPLSPPRVIINESFLYSKL